MKTEHRTAGLKFGYDKSDETAVNHAKRLDWWFWFAMSANLWALIVIFIGRM